MNRIKRTCTLLLSIVLAVVLILGVMPRISVGKVFAENTVAPVAVTSVAPGDVTTAVGADGYICLDLAAGNITIGKTTYKGYVYIGGTATEVSGTHTTENKYYIYQSNADIQAQTGYDSKTDRDAKTGCKIPQYPRVKNGVEPWSDYITNNINVKTVSENWDTAAKNSGRTGTGNNITFASESDYTADVTIDNVWSTYHKPGKVGNRDDYSYRTSGGITANLSNTGIACSKTHILLKLKGDNRVGCIHYSAGRGKGNTIEFNDGENTGASGSITVADFSSNWGANFWSSAIGGADSPVSIADVSDGIIINSGVIFAGTTSKDDSTAIGGGGNEYGGVTINGGVVTAVAATTGTAIGGGIGWSGKGGDAKVVITKGDVYAYNHGIGTDSGNYTRFVPAVAIGGGSADKAAGNTKTEVIINGGTVYAQSKGGAAIGGGGSAQQNGGAATINISGGTVIAKSVGGKVKYSKTGKGIVEEDISAGVSIGGGTGLSYGGNVELHIDGGTLRTGSIGGGKSTGDGQTGSANVTINGGDIVGQVIMAGGARTPCSFTMTDGVIHDTNLIEGNTIDDVKDPQPLIPISYSEDNGGAVWMDAHFGETIITGGTIENCSAQNGGAIYMTGGSFEISGTGKIINNTATQDGGGVYVGGGTVTVGGGSISNNTATLNGGGMYVGDGDVDVTGGSINNNTATLNGGGAYIAGNYSMTAGEVLANNATNGGGIYVNDGIVTMYGGNVDSNTATESGGGMYISATNKAAIIDIFSGSVSGNKSKTGGGVSVVSTSDDAINVTVGVQCEHPDLADGSYTPFAYPQTPEACGTAHTGHTNHIANLTHSTCPQVKNNIAEDNGGGFFLKSAQTNLIFYCVTEIGNVANGNLQCYNMDVQGGHVEIGDSSYEYNKGEPVKGNIVMQSSIWVEAGQVDVYGKMDNPRFIGAITVDIEKQGDYFIDHRRNETTGDPTATTYYKVHYYENFKGSGESTVGSYKAYQYPDSEHINSGVDEQGVDHKYDFTIISSLFSREGYKIVGWNTKADGTGTFFNVNDTYNLKNLDERQDVDLIGATDSQGNFDDYLLILYAIWENNTYALKFDPNVGTGGSYSGVMENQIVEVNLRPQTIKKLAFKRPGYEFIGWTLTPEKPTDAGAYYADGHSIVEDFTKKDGDTITLYAQWQICTHINYLVYTVGDSDNANVLTQTCSNCGRHTATATLTSVNSNYDGNKHRATVSFSVNWLGDKPVIFYTMATSDWDAKDQVVEEWNADPTPLHAGSYTAKITVNEVGAQTTFTISPVQWATPEIPKIVFKVVETSVGEGGTVTTNKSAIVIDSPTSDPTNGVNYVYRITYLKDNVETAVTGHEEFDSNREFTGIPFGYYYYFYAKQIADRDHSESEASRSEAYLATGGNIVFFKNATGIKVEPHLGDGVFDYVVSAEKGYHLRGYTDNRATAIENATPVKDANDVDIVGAYCHEGGIQLSCVKSEDGKTYTYTVKFLENKVAYYQLTLEFSGAVKNASVAHKVTEGQVFGNFNDKAVTISRDSAFTAQFTLIGYYPDEYNAPALSFTKVNVDNTVVSQALPARTTIIMKIDGNYWYCNLSATKSSISLTEFTAMGGTGKYTFVTASESAGTGETGGTTNTQTSAQTTTYQFVFDFSQSEGIDTDNLNVILGMTAKSTSVPNIPETTEGSATENKQYISLSIAEKAVFELGSTVSAEEGETATIDCNYNPSTGVASIWDGRKASLVLVAPQTAPGDLTLTAVIGGNTALYTMNADRVFIIPLDGIGDNSVKITLNSKLFGAEAENLTFTAKWYVSQSGADISPLNGYLAYTRNDVTFTCKKDPVPSVRIDGTKHLYHAGEELEVTVNKAGIPSGATVTPYLQVKTGGNYVDSAARPVIEIIDDKSIRVKFNIGKMSEGSYRILVVVKDSGANILEVPYYFVIT